MSKTYLKEAVPAAEVAAGLADVRDTVTAVIADIRARGDEAVRDYSAKFDNRPRCAGSPGRSFAFEAGPHGVSVNSLSPGPGRGARMTRNFTAEAAATGVSYEQAQEAFVSRAALHRLVEEDEVAAAVLAMLRMPGLRGATSTCRPA